jgi:hypothetical protein
MAKRYWNRGIVFLFNDTLVDEVLQHTPNGLRYHLIDICVEELAKVNKEASVPLTEATFLDCLDLFFSLAAHVDDKNVHKRIVESVMLKFLNEYSFVSDVATSEEEEDDPAKDLIFQQVNVGTVAKFIFDIASGDIDVRYRRGLYEMHKTFVRKIRAAGRDVDIDAGREEEEDCGACGACDNCAESPAGGDAIVEEEAPVVASKKAKKKKKKKKHKDDNDATDSSLGATEANENVDDPEPSAKSSKKKKNKTRKNEEADAEPNVPVAPTPTPTEIDNYNPEPTTKSKKKKRKKSEDAKEPDVVETTPPLHPASKKKKKQKTAPTAGPEIQINSDGDIIAHKTDLSPNSSDGEVQGNMSASKRVSFGARNQSKSHKASMKALKTLTPKVWSTANRTPDKSILLKRAETEVKQSKSKKKKRRSS